MPQRKEWNGNRIDVVTKVKKKAERKKTHSIKVTSVVVGSMPANNRVIPDRIGYIRALYSQEIERDNGAIVDDGHGRRNERGGRMVRAGVRVSQIGLHSRTNLKSQLPIREMEPHETSNRRERYRPISGIQFRVSAVVAGEVLKMLYPYPLRRWLVVLLRNARLFVRESRGWFRRAGRL